MNPKMALPVLMVDNFDSFTYNLVNEFEQRGCEVHVVRNSITLDELGRLVSEFNPSLIIISPGPSTPSDAGVCIELIKAFASRIPIFGVCLGHQAIIEAFGGKVARADEIVHGKASPIGHDGKTLFTGLPLPLHVGRYHSLCGAVIPECLEVSARAKDGTVMALRHPSCKTLVEGVQFHPESILTTQGGRIIQNLLDAVQNNLTGGDC
ncbi:MAG: aminodeoxychorismate/anthranilate synthase component II [archaeon]